MISKIRLENFQSHASTELELSPGINAIVGASDKGKSAIMRACEWVRLNRPVGDDFLSDWARNEKGKQTEPCRVSIEIDGHSVVRVRTPKQNGYIVDGQVTEAIGTDVPPIASTALNLSDLNVQKQLDSPFLLSQSGGDVARFFNSLVHLEDIDKCMSAADSIRRKLNQSIALHVASIDENQKHLDSLQWVASARKQLDALREIHTTGLGLQATKTALCALLDTRKSISIRITTGEVACDILRRYLPKFQGYAVTRELVQSNQTEILSRLNHRRPLWVVASREVQITVAKDRLDTLQLTIRGITGISAEYNAISTALKTRETQVLELVGAKSLPMAVARLRSIEEAHTKIRELQDLRDQISSMLIRRSKLSGAISSEISTIDPVVVLSRLGRYAKIREDKQEIHSSLERTLRLRKFNLDRIQTLSAEIETIKAQLPEKCPLCGREKHEEAHEV